MGWAYISYYAGCFRVLKYRDGAGNPDLQDVGAFIDADGNNFWGVEVHKHSNGQSPFSPATVTPGCGSSSTPEGEAVAHHGGERE
jgi:hypothetical protein